MSLHLGLDLGGTNIKVALLDRTSDGFRVVSTDVVDTGASGGPDAVASNLIAAGSAAIGGDAVDGVGLGVPGHFDRDTGVVLLFPNLPGEWRGYPLRSTVGSGLGLDTWMINDARAFTLGEGTLGAGRGCSVVACVTLGTGVGGGLMIDGRLFRGAFGVAGELGHQTVLPDGPPCGCGNHGCLEALVRADAVAADAGKATAREAFEGARDGDERCIAAVDRMAYFLGIGLANVVTVFGPEKIVVGGGIAEAGDLVLDPIERAVKRRVTLVPTDRFEVVAARFGRFAGAVGAALAGAVRA